MKELIQNNLPTLYKAFKAMYRKTFIYNRQIRKNKERHSLWQKKRLAEDLIILNQIFDNEMFVHNGPFQGMKYIGNSSGSAFLPKIMGSYEEPIHEWIEKVIKINYSKIIDIGCAEGYYTAGFAYKCPNTKVIGYDIDDSAIAKASDLIEINKLKNVLLKGECTQKELNDQCEDNCLVFCDIEGFESYFLDPLKIPNLKKSDLIIECHDFITENTTEALIRKFNNSHKITMIVDYDLKQKTYQTPKTISQDQYNRITNEYRQQITKYLFLEHYIK